MDVYHLTALTVGVVEINLLDLQPSKGLFTSSARIFGSAVDATVALVIDPVGELGREEDFLALLRV
jgi:hypothetical protein